ncbi:NAD(P)-dependent oxidoreductase, partial [Marivivens sp.]|uniref:NAD(P)-dependent oxidoreductase n=1 Tax=Marivivens sp. TaxID=1978374 RepID=UPI0025C5B1E4
MKIAFIGLGNMGAPMAANLVNAGHDVVGCDPIAKPDFMPVAATNADAVRGADVVITMLPNGAILQAVAAEIHPAMEKGAVHLDCSTVDVESARKVAQSAADHGLTALDAPVSGGVGGATNGTLTFMVGQIYIISVLRDFRAQKIHKLFLVNIFSNQIYQRVIFNFF